MNFFFLNWRETARFLGDSLLVFTGSSSVFLFSIWCCRLPPRRKLFEKIGDNYFGVESCKLVKALQSKKCQNFASGQPHCKQILIHITSVGDTFSSNLHWWAFATRIVSVATAEVSGFLAATSNIQILRAPFQDVKRFVENLLERGFTRKQICTFALRVRFILWAKSLAWEFVILWTC